MTKIVPGWTFVCTERWAKARVCSSAKEIWSHKVHSCLCGQQRDVQAEQVWCWDRKPTRDLSFRKVPFISRALRHQKGLFTIAIWHPLLGRNWGHYSWATALSFPITSAMEHWAARSSLQPSRKVHCQTKGIFWSGIFWAVPSAIALYMATFAFFLADAAFSLSSVLTIDGGKVLAVQKFMQCRKSERCVPSSGAGCCCCSAMRKREHSNVPFWMSSTAQLRSRWMVCKLNVGPYLLEQMLLSCCAYY